MTASGARVAGPDMWRPLQLRRAVRLVREKGLGIAGQYVGLEHVESGTGRLIEPVTHVAEGDDAEESVTDALASIFEPGDVLFGKLRPYLRKVHLAKQAGHCSTELLVLRSVRVTPTFLKYVLLTEEVIRRIDSSTFGAKMPRADWDFIGRIEVLVPPLDLQQHVATFLDRKTAAIDALIAKKERLIELLQEMRQATVKHALTSGSDETVPTTSSGVPWIGEVPAHWQLVRARHVARVVVPQRDKPELTDEGEYPWITTTDLTGEFATAGSACVTVDAARAGGATPFRAGTVAATCVGQFGIASILTRDAIVNQQIQGYECFGVDGAFLREMIEAFKDYFEAVATRTTIAYVNSKQFADFPVPLPPMTEQCAIIEGVRKKRREIDAVISAAGRQIALLCEYRQALISAAVTGKLDIPVEDAA